MAEIYWTKRSALSPESWRRFQETQEELRREGHGIEADRMWAASKCISKSVSLTPKAQGSLRFFIHWSRGCANPPRPKDEIGHWVIAALYGIQFGFNYQSIDYLNRCSLSPDASLLWTHEVWPEKMKGLLVLDWDQDGDLDLAVWLAGGRTLFFEQTVCAPPYLSERIDRAGPPAASAVNPLPVAL